MIFAEQLKSERERLRITQAQAASLLSMAKRTYCDWEYGLTMPLKVAQEGALQRLRNAKKPRR